MSHVHDGWGADLTNDCRGCQTEYYDKQDAERERRNARAAEQARLARIGAWMEANERKSMIVASVLHRARTEIAE